MGLSKFQWALIVVVAVGAVGAIAQAGNGSSTSTAAPATTAVKVATRSVETTPDPVSSSAVDDAAVSGAIADAFPDLGACSTLADEYLALNKTTFDPVEKTGTVDFATDSAAVSAFAVAVRQQLFADPVLASAWKRVADNSDAAAEALLASDTTSSVNAMTVVITASTAAMKSCNDYLTGGTPTG